MKEHWFLGWLDYDLYALECSHSTQTPQHREELPSAGLTVVKPSTWLIGIRTKYFSVKINKKEQNTYPSQQVISHTWVFSSHSSMRAKEAECCFLVSED